MGRAVRIGAWVAASTLVLLLVAGGALYIAGNTDRGRVMLEQFTKQLSSGHVSLSGMAGSFPGQLTFKHVELSDRRGAWLTAENVSLRWSPLALLAGRIRVATLHAERIDMQRLPESSPNVHRKDSPSIPNIDVAALSVDLLKLGPELAGEPASLVLQANAHLRSVKDMVIDATASRLGGEGHYVLHLRFDPARMDAEVNLQEPASGPLEHLLQVPGLGALALKLNLSGPVAAEQLALAVDAGAFSGRAQGHFNLPDKLADLDFAFESPALAPRADLAWQRLSLQGHWHGSLTAPKADAHLDIEQLQVPGGTRLATLTGELGADAGVVTLHAVTNGLRIPGSHPDLLQSSPLSVEASLQLNKPARPLDISLSHRLFTLHGSGQTLATSGAKRSAALELTLPDLAPLAAVAGQQARGSAVLKARLQNDGRQTQISLDGSAALLAANEFWAGAVGDRLTLQISGTLKQRTLAVDSMKLIGRALSLTGSGDLSAPASDAQPQLPATVHAKWALDVSDLKSLSSALAGTLEASGTLEGAANSLAASARLSSALSVSGSPSGRLDADVTLRGLPSAPSGTVEAHGLLDGAPLNVEVALEQGSNRSLRTLIRRADWRSVHAEGDITVASAAAQSHGQVTLQVPHLADLQHLLGVDIGGSLSGTVALHAEQGKNHTQIRLDAHELTTGPFHGDAQLIAEGAPAALGFDLDVQVPELRGAAASLSAHGMADFDAHSVTLEKAIAHYRGQDAQLLAPARIVWASGVSVDDLQLGAQQAVFALKGQLSPALHINASLRQVRAPLVNAFLPGLLASGTIEASAQLSGTLSAPTGELQIALTGVTLSDKATFGLPPVDAKASAQLTGTGATIDAHVTAGSLSHLAVAGRTPSGTSGALDLKVSGSLDVAMINPLLEARGQQASGVLTVDATVGGSLSDPQIGGNVILNKGSITDYGRGLSLTDISAVMVGSEGALQIKSLNAKAGPGTVSIAGTVGVLQPGLPVSLHITAQHAQPIASKLVTANLNANLNINGKARERLAIAGSVDLGRTLIGIPNRLPPNVAVLDVRRRGQAAPAQPERVLVVGLDIAVKAPQEFLVQGRGLDAEMGGDMHLSGTTDEPVVTGGFDLQRGSVSVGGSKLSFTAGRVSFNGAGLKKTIDPTLDFTAQSTVNGVTATLHITGLADAPQFEFTSNPSQPPDEIMALLMFGTPAAQLSALQLAQVGATLAIMSGAGGDGGLNPLVKLQQSFGLDRLNIGAAASTGPTTENSGASIAAGRYIAKRIYIEAKQSTTGTSQVEADVDLTKHLKLQTRLGNGTASVQGTTPENDPGSSVGLTYQIEY